MTQEELAKRLGYKSKTSVAHIENGSRDIPRSVIVQLADILETTPSYLMGWTDDSIETSQKLKKLVDDNITSQQLKNKDAYFEYILQNSIDKFSENVAANQTEISEIIKALSAETESYRQYLTKITASKWAEILKNLTQENLDKLQEQAELLLLKQAQVEKVKK